MWHDMGPLTIALVVYAVMAVATVAVLIAVSRRVVAAVVTGALWPILLIGAVQAGAIWLAVRHWPRKRRRCDGRCEWCPLE